MEECPKCGNAKHHETITVENGGGKESTLFKCKACGYMEYRFPDLNVDKEEDAVERMGDAFREFLAKKH
jgi:uncharacterized Zn finger protein